MAKLTDNQKLLVVAGAAVLLSGLGGGGVWWAKGLVQEKVDSIAAMRTQIQAAQAKIRKIPRVEQDVIILRENLYEYVKMLPEQSEVNDFLRVTQNFQSQSGVEISRFQPSRPARGRSPFERYSYKFVIRATLWQFMQFMSLFEDYERFVQIKDFALSSGTTRDMSGHDIVHQFNMTVETYVYRGSAGGSDVQIANYSHKVEKLREEIFEAQQTIVKPSYPFQGARGRRDIFVDPRESASAKETPRGIPIKEQRKIIDTLAGLLSDSQSIFARLQDPTITIFDKYALERRLRKQNEELEVKIQDVSDKALISHAPLRLTWNREVIEPFGKLQAQIEKRGPTDGGDDGRWLTQEQMDIVLKRMSVDLQSGDIVAAMDRYDTVEERIRVEQSDYRYPTYVKIESLYVRAKLAEEFGALMLDISGICVNEDGKSGVILNGTVYEEGEYVDDQLLIKAVARDRVEFVYKGFTVVRTR